MGGQLEKVKEEALGQIESFEALEKLNDVRASCLGKERELTNLLKSMRSVTPEGRPKVGQTVSDVRGLVEGRLEKAGTALAKKARKEQLKREVIDVTLPIRENNANHSHPNTITLEEVEHIFVGMGYEVIEGLEVEYDRYNFEKLNVPKGHSARDERDIFYINENIPLCSQTSSVQVRTMEQGKFPTRMTALDRVFRSDEVDATHSPSSHQAKGLVIDKNITFANLKGTLAESARELFGSEIKVKFRPHHFPLTESSTEMDVICFRYGGSGCRFYKGSGQIGTLGCDMMHPHVLEMCGIDPDAYSGFAFDVGPGRIVLLRYEIDGMRLPCENDIRFLKQF